VVWRARRRPWRRRYRGRKPVLIDEVKLIKLSSVSFTALFVCLISTAADAQHRNRATQGVIVCDQRGCSDRAVMRHRDDAGTARADVNVVDANGNVVGGRPAGCPSEFCGCEASLFVFGEIRRELNLASAWMRKFPRAQPAAGMAAVRNHHVMILMSHVDGRDWMVHDGNSGGRKTREHVRSIAGYVIVDPHGARAASAE
jgi:hypothetical protein